MKDRVVLIVGATSMIGQACAHLLTEKGMKLMLSAHSVNKLKNLTKTLTGHFEQCVTNICSQGDVESMLERTMSVFHRIDAVIYNAAIYPQKSIHELKLSEWKETIDTNLTGAFLTTKACARVMQKQREGKLIFISSIAGETIGLPYMSAYAASKAALNGFMRTAAVELASYNINVNSISPGKVFDPHTLSPEEKRAKLSPIPLKRFIQPSDIAEMALFLLSDQAKNITGQNFIIDGGQSILGEDAHICTVSEDDTKV